VSQGLFSSLYSTGNPFAFIDTRERRDHVNGHWFGSTNIPLSVLSPKIIGFVPEQNFPIHLLDWQDAPSAAAAKQLSKLGYTNVVRHSTSNPDAFGHGFVKGEYVWSKAFGEVLAHTCGLQEITPADYLAHYKDAHLFDVRPTAEYAQFTIPGSQSLPNSLLLANMQALKHSGECALLHCAGRTRSIIGACTLKAAGYGGPFVIFKGGTQAWQLDGLEREFNANRIFAQESDNAKPVKEFLYKWNLKYTQVDQTSLESFVSMNDTHHLFDVSDDAATGQLANHNIIKISGTNLIQQTDRSIARYHVPVILFDYGSGSRAAFAAYWLQLMGYSVSVVYLSDALSNPACQKIQPRILETPHTNYSIDKLFKHRAVSGKIFDVRSSQAFAQGHLTGSQWQNISELIACDVQSTDEIVVIGNDITHANETANLLQQHGWKIAGIFDWVSADIEPDQLKTGVIDSPVDQSALFAGRHHGNLQDSRDYLAWEEALPEQIDQILHQTWLDLLDNAAG
jgi:rhodanese-related sulfurtransferase